MGLYRGTYWGYIGIYNDDGQEHGNYFSGIYSRQVAYTANAFLATSAAAPHIAVSTLLEKLASTSRNWELPSLPKICTPASPKNWVAVKELKF